MIHGTVDARLQAIVVLRVRGRGGAEIQVSAVVDTGFTSSLTLPPTAIAGLGLIRRSGGRAILGDGTLRQFDLYNAEVEWDGNWRSVLVSGLGDEVLMGMRLLAGHDLRVAVEPGGTVLVQPDLEE